ncbi:hypothetical protein VMCG_06622 [Cytospora schulzeri]|uniref:SET domain-containing protein n=1 Tax=Cytospora schulzeri TaxID=448051 RepID=A0A423W703_9PEZI|nr:hypothetical protein VMCG_06622 [Valsa malicola]
MSTGLPRRLRQCSASSAMLTVSAETFVLDSVKVRPAGDGMGNGLFATVDIPKGTRIIAESPLVFLAPSERPFFQFCHLVRSLGDKTSQLDELFHNPILLDKSQAGNLFERIRTESGLLEVAHHRSQPPDGTMVKRYAIFLTNCNEILRGKDIGRGIFHIYSRINHSCEPNVFCDWNTNLKQETVHAARDIKAGEQILQGYLSTEDFMTRKERAAKLRSWGFTCRCSACAHPEVSDPVRKQMGTLHAELNNISQLHQNDDMNYRRGMAADGLQKAKALAELLEATGRCSWKLCQATLGNEAAAVEYARKNLEAQEIIVGKDGMDRTWIERLGLRIS